MPVEPVSAAVYQLAAKPAPIPTPADYEAQRLEQENARLTAQQKADQLREQAQANGVLRSMAGAHPDDIVTALQRVSPSAASAYQKQLADQRKSQLDSLKQQAELQKLSHEQGMRWVQLAKETGNPAAWSKARNLLIEDNEDAQVFPEQMPDGNTLDAILHAGVSVEKSLELRHQAVLDYGEGRQLQGFAKAVLAGDDDAADGAMALGVPKSVIEHVQAMTPEQKTSWAQAQLNRSESGDLTKSSIEVQAADALKRGDTEAYNRLLKVKKEVGQADDRPRVTVNAGGEVDAGAIADAIIAGEQPPTLQGLYGKGAAVRTALAKKGYNLASAMSDWTATQKHLSTLNGAQQTRMAQAVDNASHSLDVIEELAKKWDGGRFPLLNKAQLAAAKQGALGKDAQQLATQLEAQISDVTSELGNVYMGGNSPTDHALSLAAKNLSADWSKPQLLSALALARKNLQIRSNSMRNVGVAGASATNPYAPQQAAPATAAPKFRFNPATGKVEPIQ